MDLEPGKNLLHYRLVDKIGEGGMGVVWKAVDTDLDREVAIKVLPGAFSADTERLARFQREAKLLASLNHANIATVHGLHQAEGIRFLAMELVAGQDLSRHLANGALPLSRCLDVGRQIAEALEAAHESGIVHRDLKPANVVVTPEGQVKVLDFGLAKPAAEGAGDVDASLSPTLTSAGTQAGMILGTAAYLSPEQAKGMPVDRRTDIWALGVVLHELLTGGRTFKGEGLSETLAAVILKDPDLEALPADTPPRLRELIRRCLVKDARRRLRDVGEARIALEEIQADPTAGLPRAGEAEAGLHAAQAPRRASWPLALAGLAFAAVAFLAGVLLRPAAPDPLPVRLDVELSATESFPGRGRMSVFSPDGNRVVLALGSPPTLRVRELRRPESTTLSGTESAEQPFFSPDGEWIGFFAGGKLKKVSVHGGAPLTLAEARSARGGSWGEDDFITYVPTSSSGLHRIPSAGGEPEVVTTLQDDPRERSHRWPHALPGGRKALFVNQIQGTSFNDADIEMVDFETGRRRKIHSGGSSPALVAGKFLTFVRESTVYATRFDVATGETARTPVPVLEGVASFGANGLASYTLSDAGDLLFRSVDPGAQADGELVRVAPGGTADPLRIEPGEFRGASLSPDGHYLAYVRVDVAGSSANIWVHDLERDVSTRLTFAEAYEWRPSWTPDGRYVTFSSNRSGEMKVYRKPADGSGEAEVLTPGSGSAWDGGSWTPDGEKLVYVHSDASNDLHWIDVHGGEDAHVFVATDASETRPAVAPDGNWVAYESDESGEREVYVRPFPGPGGKWQISRGGGRYPVWSRDGKWLYFHDRAVIKRVSVSAEESAFRAGRPEEVVDLGKRIVGTWDVAADGTLHVPTATLDQAGEDARAVVGMIFHWPVELERLVPE